MNKGGVRWPRATLAGGGVALAFALLAVSLWPTAGVGARPLPGEADIRLALVIGAAVVLVAFGAVHWQRWRLGLDSMQLALVVDCLLSAGALLSLQLGRLWHLAWWDYHAFLLAGFAAAISAVLTGYRRSRTLHDVLDGVFASDPMAHISRGYSETLRTLAEGAYLHDVGKVGIPDHVLNKPGALSGEERAWIQQHPIVGPTLSGGLRRCVTPWR